MVPFRQSPCFVTLKAFLSFRITHKSRSNLQTEKWVFVFEWHLIQMDGSAFWQIPLFATIPTVTWVATFSLTITAWCFEVLWAKKNTNKKTVIGWIKRKTNILILPMQLIANPYRWHVTSHSWTTAVVSLTLMLWIAAGEREHTAAHTTSPMKRKPLPSTKGKLTECQNEWNSRKIDSMWYF